MRTFAIIFLLWPIFFFGAGWYEMSKAKETADWPTYPAKITSADVVKVEGGKDEADSYYLNIQGNFLGTGEPFTVKRYAYGVINGMSPHQKYLAPYKPGYVTTVYVDPKDFKNVILCNNPSLTGNYIMMTVCACVVLAILWWLIFRSKKKEEPYVRVYALWPKTNTVGLPTWAGVLIGLGLALLFLGLGIWIIYMGIVGHSLAEKWTSGESVGVIFMGLLFAYGGVMSLVMVISRGNIPPLLSKIMLSLFLVFLGLPFIVIPIFDPGGISSSASINGHVLRATKGSSVGAVVFMLGGIGCMVGAFWPWRWWKKN